MCKLSPLASPQTLNFAPTQGHNLAEECERVLLALFCFCCCFLSCLYVLHTSKSCHLKAACMKRRQGRILDLEVAENVLFSDEHCVRRS